MTSFILLLLASACATAPRIGGIDHFRKIPGARIREIPAESSVSARSVIRNHVNFLRLLFEQSRDPYFGTPKWSEACLAENHIGDLREVAHGMQSISTLYMEANLAPGSCSKNPAAKKAQLVYLYCPDSPSVYEITYFIDGSSAIASEADLCR